MSVLAEQNPVQLEGALQKLGVRKPCRLVRLGGQREATARQRTVRRFAGLIYAHQLRISIGRCIDDLGLLAKACEPEDFVDRVEYLPLR